MWKNHGLEIVLIKIPIFPNDSNLMVKAEMTKAACPIQRSFAFVCNKIPHTKGTVLCTKQHFEKESNMNAQKYNKSLRNQRPLKA